MRCPSEWYQNSEENPSNTYKIPPKHIQVWDNMERIEVNSVPTAFPKLHFFSGFYPHSAHRTIHNVT